MNIIQQDALEFLRLQADNSADVLFCDPPYALGSEIVIREDGKPDYSKAVDFMNKWEMPTGEFWEEFYKEAYRVLKYGGHCLMYGMDRQNFMFKYYGHLAGFTGKQSLYWYFISNFPKASDLSKMIDKNAGADREVVGSKITGGIKRPDTAKRSSGIIDETRTHNYSIGQEEIDITAPSTPLAKKYSGYKYSVAPLKQVVEEIMVFQKPYRTGYCLHDVLAMEAGDKELTCGALDIDGNRVGTSEDNFAKNWTNRKAPAGFNGDITGIYGSGKTENIKKYEPSGRYPAQAFIQCNCKETKTELSKSQKKLIERYEEEIRKIDQIESNEMTLMSSGGYANQFLLDNKEKIKKELQEKIDNIQLEKVTEVIHEDNCPCRILDEQSGVKKDSQLKSTQYSKQTGNNNSMFAGNKIFEHSAYGGGEGGCSKILHKCDYEKEEYDLFIYSPKVSKKERNAGCEDMEEKQYSHDGREKPIENPYQRNDSIAKNTHPTLKPISLNEKILRLFKTPNPQTILIPFAGSGSEIIGAMKAKFEDIRGCEINEEYVKIAKARIKYYEKELKQKLL